MRILITGYAGFIGSNLVRKIADNCSPNDQIIGLDCFTYAARPDWAWKGLKDKVVFYESKTDLRNATEVNEVIKDYVPDQVYHLAAESHVCRSIEGPRAFAETNFMGTFNLLEALRSHAPQSRIVHVSTDEAFGELRHSDDPFDESSSPNPTSPYSASKCAADMMVRAYANTYKTRAVITRCTNNYGPNQHFEKLIPKTIMSIINEKEMTIYGDGSHSRDWIHVDDHCDALIAAMHEGMPGQLYCVGSGLELTNKQVVNEVVKSFSEILCSPVKLDLVTTDSRPTDDNRYAVRTDKVQGLGWKPNGSMEHFRNKIKETIEWYLENER